MYSSTNPGDKNQPNQTLGEEAKGHGVDAPNLKGNDIQVPSYFIMEYRKGQKEALDHVQYLILPLDWY